MPIIRIPIREILTDPDTPVDLSALPEDELVDRIKALYAFLPSMETVSVDDDLAVITTAEANVYREEAALDTRRRAGRAAQQGNYRATVEMFEQVLEVIPHHAETHRDLSMAYYELGNSQQTKRYVVQALRLEPGDAWSWVVLGNTYVRLEDDTEQGERYFKRAYELDPTDLYVLNSYATLKAKQGQYTEARALYEQAIAQDRNHPNPRYGLALCYAEEGELETALLTLEETCSTAPTGDARSDPVYEQARALYLEVNHRLAEQSGAEMMAQLEEDMERWGEETGTPVELQEDRSLDTLATIQLAWVYGRGRHIIKHQPAPPELLAHRVAHQFELIRLNHRAREAGRAKVFASTQEQQEYAMRVVRHDADRLRKQGITGARAEAYLKRILDGLLSQLYSAPLELIAEYRLYHRYPFLHPSQFLSLRLIHEQNARAVEDESIRAMSPRIIWEANVAMSCAYAEPYRQSSVYSTGGRLFELWRSRLPTFGPGDEYDLVDEFARALKLERWYEWRAVREGDAAPKQVRKESAQPKAEGLTSAELLKQKEPATMMYLLDALQRFDRMEPEQIQEVTVEIGMLGRSGLDYADSEKKYTLRSLPGERFSGLHLMALMYVGFKRLDPEADTGIPFDDAYAMALALHQGKE